MERKHFNPYQHWFSGIVTEIAVFAALIAVLAGATLFAGLWGR